MWKTQHIQTALDDETVEDIINIDTDIELNCEDDLVPPATPNTVTTLCSGCQQMRALTDWQAPSHVQAMSACPSILRFSLY